MEMVCADPCVTQTPSTENCHASIENGREYGQAGHRRRRKADGGEHFDEPGLHYVTNPAALGKVRPGMFFYVDLTLTDKDSL
jgi:hypothetical protein